MERIRPRSPIRREQSDWMHTIWIPVVLSTVFLVVLALSVFGLV